MIFIAPWVLLALTALPLLWWLLRVTPPAPRRENFPAIRLLLGLKAREETPARTPWWLLLLRCIAAALVIIGLAGPILDAGSALPGVGPVLLVLDNGWASAAGWPRRIQAADTVLDRAARAGRPVALLATAADDTGAAPTVTPLMPPAELRARLAAMHPEPWPADRPAATAALKSWKQSDGSVVYLADGLTDGNAFTGFAQALGAAGPVTELCCDVPARLLLPPESTADSLVARIAQVPQPAAANVQVLAQTGDGRTLAQATIEVPAGASTAQAAIVLPPELRNRLTRLVLANAPSAGSVVLLDERWRRRPVGLVTANPEAANAPFVGPLYYLLRALTPYTEVRQGTIAQLLARQTSVIVLADDPLPDGPDRDALTQWVEKGGLLIRLAGPRTAAQPIGETDKLLPVKLLGGDRQLGGALSWSQPAGLAPFPPGSPFAGLSIPADVTVSRQVLAEPSATLAAHTWAALADGTPLVTEAARGNGRIVLFHVTANDAWSNLPLSGLFVDMLRRLVALSVGVQTSAGHAVLAPVQTLDGYGLLSPPTQAATGLAADQFGQTPASPQHPPGLYGPENGRQALNLSSVLARPEAAPTISGAQIEPLTAAVPERAIGPWLMSAAVALLALDLLISLLMRGLLRPTTARRIATILIAGVLGAGLLQAGSARAELGHADPALGTRLGYITSGDAQVDGVAKQGLEGLSEYVNARTAATLDEPDAITPGKTDLSFYPLLYWPITADAQPLSDAAASALNDYMNRGGILLIDTRDTGSGAGFAPGTGEALQRIARGLVVPPLTPLTIDHVLARTFYLLRDYPGRYDGGNVWVQQGEDRSNDDVSPVIIGGNDWAAAWAVDAEGHNPYAVIPGGERQRTLAYRFGVNLVMYALTGNYKGDQVHVKAILERLGQ
ncbi:MAG TPA: DUF4159 domain-containing protein [Acetobacteraceae bacterium]|nr:DUF4159 domain-containing protein [Acetobacteraceae bacterium]